MVLGYIHTMSAMRRAVLVKFRCGRVFIVVRGVRTSSPWHYITMLLPETYWYWYLREVVGKYTQNTNLN